MIVTQGSIVTVTAMDFTNNGFTVSVPLKISSNLFRSSSYTLRRYLVEQGWNGVQYWPYYWDVIPLSTVYRSANQNNFDYFLGLTGAGTTTLVWDTTNVPSGLYFVGSNLTMSPSAAPLSVFVASPVPTTKTYRPDALSSNGGQPWSITVGCLGGTLILHRPTGTTSYMTPRDIFVSCISASDVNEPPSLSVTILASGPAQMGSIRAVISKSRSCGLCPAVLLGPSRRDRGPQEVLFPV
jgi:hypothetical protein